MFCIYKIKKTVIKNCNLIQWDLYYYYYYYTQVSAAVHHQRGSDKHKLLSQNTEEISEQAHFLAFKHLSRRMYQLHPSLCDI